MAEYVVYPDGRPLNSKRAAIAYAIRHKQDFVEKTEGRRGAKISPKTVWRKNPAQTGRRVRKNSITIRNAKSVAIKRNPDGTVAIRVIRK